MKLIKTLFSVLLALTGWACLIFAGVAWGIKAACVVALGMIVAVLMGRVV